MEYFVSYYDYYQPEAYLPQTDTYIAKDASINETIDKMRHSATRSRLDRNDVVIVASVSCIYGLGSPEAYQGMLIHLEVGREAYRDEVLRKLVEIQYERNDYDFHRGTFRVRGDVLEVFPAYEEDRAGRIEFFGDFIDAIREFDPLTGRTIQQLDKVAIYPGSHYVTSRDNLERAISAIQLELKGSGSNCMSMACHSNRSKLIRCGCSIATVTCWLSTNLPASPPSQLRHATRGRFMPRCSNSWPLAGG